MIKFNPNGDATVEYTIHAKNYSNNPAQHVWAFAQLLVTQDTFAIHDWQTWSCGEHLIGNREVGVVLFPGRLRAFSISSSLFERTKMVSKTDDGKFEGWLVGCIGYRDQAGFLYRTGFTYWLTDPAMRDLSFPLRIDPSDRSPVSGNWKPYTGSAD
jgi:hypothetical protein